MAVQRRECVVCVCDICGNVWVPRRLRERLPHMCAKCKSVRWNYKAEEAAWSAQQGKGAGDAHMKGQANGA